MNTTALDVLKEASDLLSDPERWTQRTYAEDADGFDVAPQHPAACRWCAIGALRRKFGTDNLLDDQVSIAIEILVESSYDLFFRPITSVNDDSAHAHSNVLQCYREAIERHDSWIAAERASQS